MPGNSCGCHNIEAKGVAQRRRAGFACLLFGFGLVLLNKLLSTAAWVQWTPTIPFFFGYLCLLQAQTKTCVVLALMDQQMKEGQLAAVEDRETGWRLKKRALKVIGAASVLALLSTLACLNC